MPHKNPAEKRAYEKRYRTENRDKINARRRENNASMSTRGNAGHKPHGRHQDDGTVHTLLRSWKLIE